VQLRGQHSWSQYFLYVAFHTVHCRDIISFIIHMSIRHAFLTQVSQLVLSTCQLWQEFLLGYTTFHILNKRHAQTNSQLPAENLLPVSSNVAELAFFPVVLEHSKMEFDTVTICAASRHYERLGRH